MKTHYLLVPVLASLKAFARPGGVADLQNVNYRADDPPPAPAPLPPSRDGVLIQDPSKATPAKIINYTPNTCFTVPASQPPPGDNFEHGTCSMCLLQRRNLDGSADFQLWARDNGNNAMGMMDATIWPLDNLGDNSGTAKDNMPVMPMGGSGLELSAMLSSNDPKAYHVFLFWGTPHEKIGAAYDPAATPFGESCTKAGSATNGQVIYVSCTFDCPA